MRRVAVRHAFYGCETGCCGQVVEDAETGEELLPFDFLHRTGRKDSDMLSVKLGYDVEIVEWESCYDDPDPERA